MKRPPGRPTLSEDGRRIRRDFRVPPDVNRRLKAAADRNGVDETSIVVGAIDRELKRMEEAEMTVDTETDVTGMFRLGPATEDKPANVPFITVMCQDGTVYQRLLTKDEAFRFCCDAIKEFHKKHESASG